MGQCLETGSGNTPMACDRWDEAGATTNPAAYHYSAGLLRDFSYSDEYASCRVAERGYPAGDLNWLPELKKMWEQGQDAPEPTSNQEADPVISEFRRSNHFC